MTTIEWADEVWNPVRGCSRVSEGCRHCYAERQAHRFSGEGQPYEGLTVLVLPGPHKARRMRPRWTGEVRTVPEMLDRPMRWRKPRRVFVNSMSDLFHESVPFEFIASVFGVMAAAPQHKFQILTKRPARMHDFLTHPEVRHWVAQARAAGETQQRIADRYGISRSLVSMIESGRVWGPPDDLEWPLRSVWLGVSVEDQATADERIPHLLACPAAVRWVSLEPMLGPVDLRLSTWTAESHEERRRSDDLHWVVVGGESGPDARPFELGWARQVVADCKAAGTPVFMKQLGARPREGGSPVHLSDRKGGDIDEWPADLRVRQWPREVRRG